MTKQPRKPKPPQTWQREAWEAFIADLPSLLRWWVAFCVAAVVIAWVTGYEKWPAALWLGVGLLPFGVSMIPAFWMSAGWSGFGLFVLDWRRQVKLLAVVVGWMFVTLFLALLIAIPIWSLGGVDHV